LPSDSWNLLEELRRRAVSAEGNDATAFYETICVVNRYLEENYYGWIQATCQFYTEHGEPHIRAVIESASQILAPYLNENPKGSLTNLDIFVILNSIMWHDVGNVLSRHGHAERINGLTNHVRSIAFPTPHIQNLVVTVAQAHSGREGLDIPRPEMLCPMRNGSTYAVYPKALAAIVRFADEISENQTRISQALLASADLPLENRIFWEYANCIASCTAQPLRERILVEIEIEDARAVRRFPCSEFQERVGDDNQITLIEYLMCRLEKMNNERAYCAPEFRPFVTIRTVDVRMALHRPDETEPYETVEFSLGDAGLHRPEYPRIDVFERFFATYEAWTPARIQEAMTL
jgi:hypothetical protein